MATPPFPLKFRFFVFCFQNPQNKYQDEIGFGSVQHPEQKKRSV